MDEKLTPMFAQWRRIKQEHPDAILLFRMGDFYELFGTDAERASSVLNLYLTARDAGEGQRMPMCGLPYHALDRYLSRLLESGFQVAICEQLTDPKLSKGLVDRAVIRVLTRGTAVEDFLLDARRNNYLMAIEPAPEGSEGPLGAAWLDVSCGEFWAAELVNLAELEDMIARVRPSECLVPSNGAEDNPDDAPPLLRELVTRLKSDGVSLVRLPRETALEPSETFLSKHLGTASLRGFGFEGPSVALDAAAAVMRYAAQSRLKLTGYVRSLKRFWPGEHMVIDAATERNLELVRPLREGPGQKTLLGVLDRTVTPMGARLFRQWLLHPLRKVDRIEQRLDAVEALAGDSARRAKLRDALRSIRDLERMVSRVATLTASPRDLAALARSLAGISAVRQKLSGFETDLLKSLFLESDEHGDVRDLLFGALVDDPPMQMREGGIIRSGFNAELDELKVASTQGKEWIAALEATERERTGIKSLKVGFNTVFGYYLEVTHTNANLVPPEYIRKQTLRNAERYITPELKEYESMVLGAEERICNLEYELFLQVREEVAAHSSHILTTARALATVDVLAALADVAVRNRYSRPRVDESDVVAIRAGRHPVVEEMGTGELFVPNDACLDNECHQMHIVTGPNMAGKSTYLRQVALIVLMGQIGSFVPAAEARIGVADRIFTRVGANDDLATGQSTFMVEMTETACILHNATPKSLILLDEVGRGTSTFDGLSLAWAVAEYIHEMVGAKTLFATHYHQLNALAETLPRVHNYRVLVREEGDKMVFLRKIVEGGTDRSYGIQVAKLAGVPEPVIERAKQVLWSLETENHVGEMPRAAPEPPRLDFAASQLSLFGEPAPDPRVEYLEQLARLDVEHLTPMAALQILHDLQEQLRAHRARMANDK